MAKREETTELVPYDPETRSLKLPQNQLDQWLRHNSSLDASMLLFTLNGYHSITLVSEEQHPDLTRIYKSRNRVPFERSLSEQGDLVIPEGFEYLLGLTDRATIIGKGSLFEIWKPESAVLAYQDIAGTVTHNKTLATALTLVGEHDLIPKHYR